MANLATIGAVKPHVRQYAQLVNDQFKPRSILGIGMRPNPSDHMRGLALDFMVYSDRAKGDAIASHAVSNAGKHGVTYVIWNQRIWSYRRAQEGWRAMEDRGTPTANHKDHVHVSFTVDGKPDSDGGGGLGDPFGRVDGALDALNPLKPLQPVIDAVQWLMEPHNLLRIAMFVGGAALMVIALVGWAAVSSGVVNTVKKGTVRK